MRTPSRLITLPVFLAVSISAHSAGFTNTAPMYLPRVMHTATVLPDGKMLVTGGVITNRPQLATDRAELFDPATGTWTRTTPMSTARRGHFATLLPDGRVLVAGGYAQTPTVDPRDTTELYDPSKGNWTTAARMHQSRALAKSVLLPNGEVLVAGGTSDGSVEIYDPLTDNWKSLAGSGSIRNIQSSTLLPDGRVLFLGAAGYGGVYAIESELRDPVSDKWSGFARLNQPRMGVTANLLSNGQVLVVGGGQPRPSLATAELYDPSSNKWLLLVAKMNAPRQFHSATLLTNGLLLVAGGYEHTNADVSLLHSAELFDSATGRWTNTSPLSDARYMHSATLLQDGRVLIVGGWGTKGVLASAELFVPAQESDALVAERALLARKSARIATIPPPPEQTPAQKVISNAVTEISGLASAARWKYEEIKADATEPKYKGKTLSHWLSSVEMFSSRMPSPLTPEAKVAIKTIGTNAVPFLLKRVDASPNGFDGTIEAFAILGAEAGFAIPALARIATNQPVSLLRAEQHEKQGAKMFGYAALASLGNIGPDALPALLTILTNAIAPGTKLGAIQAISHMATNAAEAVPVLARYGSDENEMVAQEAVSAVGKVGAGNPAALAALEKSAQSPNRQVRSSATMALSSFGKAAVPALVVQLTDTNPGIASIAFHSLVFAAPTALTNREVIAIAAEALGSPDEDRREWAAYALRAIGQQAEGAKPDLMAPVSWQDRRFEEATNVLRRLVPDLVLAKPHR